MSAFTQQGLGAAVGNLIEIFCGDSAWLSAFPRLDFLRFHPRYPLTGAMESSEA
jgi:hypothetical protein